jgi:nitroreductase
MPDTAPSNPVLAAILARRSIRSGFSPEQVPVDVLEKVVASGLAAPSSKNARPWRLHVVRGRAALDALAVAAETADDLDDYVPHDPLTGRPYPEWRSTVLESAAVLREAPCAIAIENRGVFSRGVGTLASIPREALAASLTAFGLESMGLGTALENMWLAANSLGLGVAFLGDLAIATPAARTLLGLEGDLVGVIALGYSEATPPPRREPPPSTQSETPVVWH